MKITNKRNSAMITIELAASLTLIVLVLFVTLGLFGDNLKSVFANSNFKNVFEGNSARTFFSFFNRDYANSQIDVQIMGEQGYGRLRQKANNSAIDLTKEALSLQAKGEAVPQSTINTIAYLAEIVYAVSGSPNFCRKLDKPSTELCPMLTGDKYNVNPSSKQIADTESGSTLALNVIINTSNNSASIDEKLKEIGRRYNGFIDQNYSLARDIEYFLTHIDKVLLKKVSSASATSEIEDEIINLIKKLMKDAKHAKASCNGLAWVVNAIQGKCITTQVSGKDYKTIDNLTGEIVSAITQKANEAQRLANESTASTDKTVISKASKIKEAKQNLIAKSWKANQIKTEEPIIAGAATALLLANMQEEENVTADTDGRGGGGSGGGNVSTGGTGTDTERPDTCTVTGGSCTGGIPTCPAGYYLIFLGTVGGQQMYKCSPIPKEKPAVPSCSFGSIPVLNEAGTKYNCESCPNGQVSIGDVCEPCSAGYTIKFNQCIAPGDTGAGSDPVCENGQVLKNGVCVDETTTNPTPTPDPNPNPNPNPTEPDPVPPPTTPDTGNQCVSIDNATVDCNVATDKKIIYGNYTFDYDLVVAPLDSRVMKVANYETRLKILTIYSQMIEFIWNGRYSGQLFEIFNDDQINRVPLYETITKGLYEIAKRRGLRTVYDQIISQASSRGVSTNTFAGE